MSEEAISATNMSAPETKKPKTLLVILMALFVVLLASGGAWVFLHRGKTAAAAPKDTNPISTVHLDGFTVNLADPEESHFLRITIDLGLGRAFSTGEKEKDGVSQFPIARTRDAILSVLTACKADTLSTPEGKVQLKHDLLQALQQTVPELDVREIYFTEFLVQR